MSDELMVHVESIVRPVRATQRRKLGMRRELLAHLQAALDEERERDPINAPDRAKRRLGVASALSDELQRSVPAWERSLLARVPMPGGVERWESRSTRRMLGVERRVTMPHMSMLVAAATVFPYAAVLALALRAGPPATYLASLIGHPVVVIAYDLLLMGIVLSLLFSSIRLVAAFAFAPGAGRASLRLASLIVGLLFLALVTCVCGLGRRAVSVADLLTFGVTALVLLALLALTGRLVAAVDRPYREWLTLA